ncbi:ATP-binding protein [Candidatus Woesearchaeota archaeon]|nr:ATP-binding protein [Candidatus Woesearchaeota archaeon]
MPNPYDPQTPARPEYFGGREPVLKRLRERIEMAKEHKKSGGVLIYGHRGVGKTSLINKIISEMAGTEEKPSDILIINRRLGRTTNDQELYRILCEELILQVNKRKNIVEKMKSMAKNINGISLFNIGVERSNVEPNRSSYHIWRTYIENLKDVKLILIAIDDADWLSIEAIGELKTIVEEISTIPILLTISGFIDFEEKLVDKYSPVARIFSGASFNIGRFSLEETKEVICKPLVNEKTKWEDEAITILHKVTGGYPYLVQCLASASYSDGNTINISRVKENIKQAVKIGQSWLDHEIPDASDQDVISFAKITNLNKDIVQSIEISKVGVSPPYVGRLVKLRILKKLRRGRYSIEKSPMIATFELLKRELTIT